MHQDDNQSVTSEDNRRGLDEFNDFASEKMNESMVSKDGADAKQPAQLVQ